MRGWGWGGGAVIQYPDTQANTRRTFPVRFFSQTVRFEFCLRPEQLLPTGLLGLFCGS